MKQAKLLVPPVVLAVAALFTSVPPVSAATITASNCTQAAVQSAVTAAAEGDTVVVPAGSCTWTAGIGVAKGIKLTGASKGGVTITHSAGNSTLISVTTSATSSTEISNLTFNAGTVSGSAEYLSVGGTGKPALVHDNYFLNKSYVVNCMTWSAKGGVIWNNTFESLEANGSGGGCLQLKAVSNTTSWTTSSTMGTADADGTANVYVENNTFKKIYLQAIDVDDNQRAVIRYNTFDNSAITYHGADTSPSGVRHVETYNNKFIFTTSGTGYNFPLNLNFWVYMRGGSGVWADNDMQDISSQMWGNKSEITMTVQNLTRNAGSYPCWKTYPAPHQVGQSSNGTSAVTDPVYIWNNAGGGSQTPGLPDYSPDECGNGLHSSDFIQSGRDYVIGTPKPGYTKYTYPHPLTKTGTSQGLSAPGNLRVL